MAYVIIGNSAAGIHAVEAIRERDQKGKIILIDRDDRPVYSRPLLSYYISGKVNDDAMLYRPHGFYKDHKVLTRFGKQASRIDPKEKKVFLEDGTKVSYDKLLLATGSAPIFPDIGGNRLAGVFGVREYQDARGILERTQKARNALFVGGGFVSLRTAYALHQSGLRVTIVVASGRLLSRALDAEAAGLVQERLEQMGFKVLTGRDVVEIEGEDQVSGVVLDSGEHIKAEIVIVGKGVTPNVSLAKNSGIKVKKGVLVNEYLETSAEGIYAAGDVAETIDVAREERTVNALWPNATEQGSVAGMNMAGARRKYAGSLGMNSLEFFGLPVISMGITAPRNEKDFEILIMRDPEKGIFKKIVLRDGVVKGAILVGDIDRAGILTGFIKSKTDVSAFKDELIKEGFGLIKLPQRLKTEKIFKS